MAAAFRRSLGLAEAAPGPGGGALPSPGRLPPAPRPLSSCSGASARPGAVPRRPRWRKRAVLGGPAGGKPAEEGRRGRAGRRGAPGVASVLRRPPTRSRERWESFSGSAARMVSPKTRYLVFFQYFGTKYSGVMETSVNQSGIGVQNYLEKAAQNLKPVVPIKFHISSRTDSGVHALCNAAHLDIQRAPGKPAFRERELIRGLNHCLKPEPIRILSAYQVTSDFHARFSALSRTYIYRLLLGCAHWSEIPVFERDLCWAPLGGYLDVPAMQDAARFLLGTHDFSTFRSLNSETPFQSPIRTIVQAEIQPSSGFLAHHYESRGLEFWELKFRSKSFLYRQVRRMVGALVAVGQGKLTPHHIKELLEVKDARAFPPHAMAPPSGLFLKSVEYDEADLHTTRAPGE
nr:tRNA pseudouridine synthase-like 1 isoform X2 [Anser cygnoides]